jgi:hypothetical protein
MNKRLIGGLILSLVLIFISLLGWDNSLHEQEDLRMPVSLGSYSGYGDYKIDPETILISLENGNSNVFEPLLEDPRDIEEVTDISISWTQADFMRIFSALSELVWDDSMDPKVWSIYDINFTGGCIDKICDLDFAKIVYFKKTGNSYTTRFMDIQPYFGLVRWGDGASYRQPILRKWKGVDLALSKVSAEGALRMAEENGGREKRLKISDRCGVYIYSSRFNDDNWNIAYHFGLPPYSFHVAIDLETGIAEFLNANQ